MAVRVGFERADATSQWQWADGTRVQEEVLPIHEDGHEGAMLDELLVGVYNTAPGLRVTGWPL